MAEPFKTFLNAPLVHTMAEHLWRAWPAFDARTFVQHATRGLDDLELKARALHLADALERTLPSAFPEAADVLDGALATTTADPDAPAAAVEADGLMGWALWPVGEFIARRGLDHPARALQALHALTQRFTAEFAIRPFVVAHPDLTLRTLHGWVHDPSAHVRRLVSEGTRPRLPWGLQLKPFIADPAPTLPLLRALQDDASGYVRRSVANHLNDIAKDHPALVADWLETHLPAAGTERRALLRHASRTLIKRGDRRVLAAWGLGARFTGEATLAVTPDAIRLGESVTLTAQLSNTGRQSQTLAVDYVVHHVRANGGTSAKVFKGWTVTLAAGASRTLIKRHAVRPITTRRYHAGAHRVELQVNGRVVTHATFHLDR